MGIQKNIRLKGTHGNAVFYELNGKGIVRSKPAQVKQTKASKASATLFGKVSQLGKLIRQQLKPYMPVKPSKQLQYALDSALRAAYSSGNWNVLVGFNMNQNKHLMDHWTVPLSIERLDSSKLSITIPALSPVDDIMAPIGTTTIKLQLVAMHIGYEQPAVIQAHEVAYDLPYTNERWQKASWQIPFPQKAGTVLLVALKLRFLWANEQNPLPQMDGCPFALIAVWG